MDQGFKVLVADSTHVRFAEEICNEMAESAKARGTGIAKRDPAYLEDKMKDGKAVIAFAPDGKWAGFCYIECWGPTPDSLYRRTIGRAVWQKR